MPKLAVLLFFFFCCHLLFSQDRSNLDFFQESIKANSPVLRENENKKQIGEIQNDIIRAQNNAFQVNATSEVLFAPYFNNNGRIIDVTTTPSSTAYGYDVGISNGGLYSAQINVTKNLFNQAIVDNLLFQSKINNEAISLSSKEIEHNLIKNITDAYVMAYQLQLQKDFTRDILKDLSKRLEVLELLVKRGVLQESDYLLLQLDTESKNLELKQIENNLQVTIKQLYTFSGMIAQPTGRLSAPVISKNHLSEETNRFYEQRFVNDSLQIMADQRVFENAYKPQLTAYGNTGLNAVEIPNIEHKLGLSAGLRLTIPIYDGKQRQYNAEQSMLREESLTYYKDNAEIQLKNNLLSIKDQIIALQENKMLLDKQIEKQVNILEIYKGKLVQGQVSIVDYLNVIQNYKQSIYTQLQMQTNLWLLQSQYNFINW